MSPISGWGVVGGYAAGVVLWAAGVLLVVEGARQSWPLIMRGTARGSFTLFVLSLVAPIAGGWLRRNAGFLFVTFGVSHVLHAVAITTLAVMTRMASLGGRVDPSHLGGLAVYGVILAIATGYALRGGAESAARRVRNAQEIGLHVVWLAFVAAYAGNARDRPDDALWPILALVVLAVALALRWTGKTLRR